ncbi:endonuclease domain-containing protein [Bounagaea algeriensis]
MASTTTRWWAGDPICVPEGFMPILSLVCCGRCYLVGEDCIASLLHVVLRGTACSVCDHGEAEEICHQCAAQVFAVAERCRNSVWWDPLDEASEAHQALRIAATCGLVDKVAFDSLSASFDLDEWLAQGGPVYLATHLEPLVGKMTIAKANEVIDVLQEEAPVLDWPRTQPRIGDSNVPPRANYHRGEMELARRRGFDEPLRYIVERQVRDAAVRALTEADFVRLAHERGVRLIPFISPSGDGVLAYSAVLTTLPEDLQYEYGGKKLARDLTLGALRATWGSEPDEAAGSQAWFTWLRYTGIQAALEPPQARKDGVWRWLHPEAQLTEPVAVLNDVPATPHARRETAREILTAGQAGLCAMCSIRRRHWRTIRAGTPAEELPVIAPGTHLDHDHDTGLIRGMLCAACNGYREPTGAKSDEAVWRAYVTNTPASELGCAWLYD